MKALSEFLVSELPLVLLHYTPEHLGARKGVTAYGDLDGGAEAAQPYGTYSRNSRLWEVR